MARFPNWSSEIIPPLPPPASPTFWLSEITPLPPAPTSLSMEWPTMNGPLKQLCARVSAHPTACANPRTTLIYYNSKVHAAQADGSDPCTNDVLSAIYSVHLGNHLSYHRLLIVPRILFSHNNTDVGNSAIQCRGKGITCGQKWARTSSTFIVRF